MKDFQTYRSNTFIDCSQWKPSPTTTPTTATFTDQMSVSSVQISRQTPSSTLISSQTLESETPSVIASKPNSQSYSTERQTDSTFETDI